MIIEGRYHCAHGVGMDAECNNCAWLTWAMDERSKINEANLTHSTVYQKAVSSAQEALERVRYRFVGKASGSRQSARIQAWAEREKAASS